MLSPQTIASYAAILKELQTNFKCQDLSFTKKTPAVIKYIEELPKAYATRKLYYAVLVSTLRDLKKGRTKLIREAEEIYRAKMIEYNTKLAEKAAEQTLSERESKIYLEWPEIIRAWENLDLQKSEFPEDYALLSCYVLSPPLRADWSPVRVASRMEDTSGNTLVVNASGMVLVLKEYKTATKYGEKCIEIPPALEEVLNDWLKVNTSGWLFADGGPRSERWIAKRLVTIMKRLTGKGAGINIFRHSYITHMRAGEKPILESEKLASSMCHSVGMSHLYRRL
jgi:hypothetical protein